MNASLPYYSLFTFSLIEDSNSMSPIVLAAIPLCAKALEVYCLSNVLPISTATIHTRFFYSSSFTHHLLTLDSSGVLLTSLLIIIPLLYEAPSKYILLVTYYTSATFYTSILRITVDL